MYLYRWMHFRAIVVIIRVFFIHFVFTPSIVSYTMCRVQQYWSLIHLFNICWSFRISCFNMRTYTQRRTLLGGVGCILTTRNNTSRQYLKCSDVVVDDVAGKFRGFLQEIVISHKDAKLWMINYTNAELALMYLHT